MKEPTRRSPFYLLALLFGTFLWPGIKEGIKDIVAGQIKDRGVLAVLKAATKACILVLINHPFIAAGAAVAAVVILAIWYILWQKFGNNKSQSEDESKERAYLEAVAGYIEILNQPLGYDEREFTPAGGNLIAGELIKSRYLLRLSSDRDKGGFRARDIVTSGSGSYIQSVLPRVLQSRQPIVLLGAPGSGKSVTLRQIALNLARDALRQSSRSAIIPIYINLGAYTDLDGNCPISLTKFIKYQLLRVIPGGNNIGPNLDRLLLGGRLAFLFDSMDEMPRADFSKRVDELRNFIVANGTRNRIVVACREREFTGVLRNAELIILPFDSVAIKAYLKKSWDIYKEQLPADRREQKYTDLVNIAASTYPLSSLASNPYFLKLTTRYFFLNNGNLPTSQVDLLQDYILTRLRNEAARKGVGKSEIETMFEALSALAFSLVSNSRGTSFTPDDLRRGISGDRADEFVDLMVDSGLLKQAQDNSLRFEHHRLQEFLAARGWGQLASGHTITATQLENPWWRETIGMRAGITHDFSNLLGQIIACIDDGYLARIHLKRITVNETQPLQPLNDQDFAALLNYLAAFELAMTCATQRWPDVPDQRQNDLKLIARGIVDHGSVLEKVRLARSLRKAPIAFSVEFFARLANDENDWVAAEAMASLNPCYSSTPEYEKIMYTFLWGLRDKHSRLRLDVLMQMVRSGHIRFELRSMRLLASYIHAIATGLLSVIMFLLFAVTARYYGLMDQTNIETGHYYKFSLALMLLMGSVYLAAGSFPMFVALVAYGAALTLVNSQVAWLFMIGLVAYLWNIGHWFQRAIWITPRWRRLLTLFPVLHFYEQMFVCWNLACAALLVIGWRVIGSPLSPIYWFYPGVALAIIIPFVVERAYMLMVRKIIERSEASGDDGEIHATIDCLIEQLKRPLSREAHGRILSRIANLPLKEETIIRALHDLAESSQFFLPPKEVLQAIDRVDLRRRQKELGASES